MKNNPLKETIRALLENHAEHVEFLHSPNPLDDEEGQMVKGRLHSVIDMCTKLEAALHDGDQLPAWVQDHLTVAYEKIHDVFSYMSTKFEDTTGENADEDLEDEDDEDEDEGEE